MIKKLRIKFTALALTALFVLLAVIVVGMNLLNYKSVVDEADATLSLMSRNKGIFPNLEKGRPNTLPPDMSPEIPFESRFFSVFVNETGEIVHTDTRHIFTVDDSTATQYAEEVLEKNTTYGFTQNFRYIRTSETNGTRITFLDCGRKLDLCRDFALSSIAISLLGYALIAIAVCFFVGKFIQPIAESYEKQKRFITDAGHEIKTPLTIISANADVLKMDIGDNECLDDIQQQTKRLTSLTNELVYLARMEETKNPMQMIEFPVSDIIQDTANPFQTLAQTQGKELSFQVQPMLSMCGNDKAISQLVSLLLDNALKYSPKGSRIILNFKKQGKKLVLTVSNASVTELSNENLRHVFDRFYRTDASRNSETGGHGIGLSIAQAIVSAHKGKISAAVSDEDTFLITATFPAQNT